MLFEKMSEKIEEVEMSRIETNKTISIIVPIYNAEKYLRRCIDSILNSTYKELELILVDDGSMDDSPRICDEYVLCDERVKVIHKKNAGTELARADGIAMSNGQYMMFVDADDYITEDIINHGITAMIDHDSDIVCFDYHRGSGRRKFAILESELLDVKEALENLLTRNKLDGNLWCKIYKTELIKMPNVIFRKKRHCDFLTTVEIIENAKKIYLLPECGYVYSITEGSSTNRNTCHERLEEYEKEAERFHEIFSRKYPDLSLASEYNFLSALLFVMIKMEKDENIKRSGERYMAVHDKLKQNMKRYMGNPYISARDKIQALLCRWEVFSGIWKIYMRSVKRKSLRKS